MRRGGEGSLGGGGKMGIWEWSYFFIAAGGAEGSSPRTE